MNIQNILILKCFMFMSIILLHTMIYVKKFIQQSSLNCTTEGHNQEKVSQDIFMVK
jgi:hypothetical protein